jgi:hypothetical protein
MFRAYECGLIKSVLFRCHFEASNTYPTYQTMSTHLNKTNHKISFLGIRDNVGSTTFAGPATPDMQHSFGVPRFFFRFNLTSAISQQPYGYVHWSMFKVTKCHRTSFEGTMTRHEWTTGPSQRPRINPFCYIEDVIPSRFALGFDEDALEFHFMALDPERVGLENIEVPQVCDFGDNELDYMTRRGRLVVDDITDDDDDDVDDVNDDVVEDVVDDDVDDASIDDDDSDVHSTYSSSSEDSIVCTQSESIDHAVLPAKFIAFLKS